MNIDPLCAGDPAFHVYMMEVVQRIGYDSFTPDNGVLIAQNKDREGRTCGYNCFTWVIDAHPEDIEMVHFVKPDGTKVMRTIADYRQLNDALFHAGIDRGTRQRGVGMVPVGTDTPVADTFQVRVTNTGTTVDVFRLSASSEDAGWSPTVANALLALEPGQSADVPVYATLGPGAGRVTVSVTSESDPKRRQTVTTSWRAP